METNKKIIILGAGISGLSAAHVLARFNNSVLVIEKTKDIGGLAVTKQKDSFRYDLGPHNIHTRLDHIVDYLRSNFTDFYAHLPLAKIYKNGKFIKYPIRGMSVLGSMRISKIPFAAISFITARWLMWLRTPRNDQTLQDWVLNRFGRVVYSEYFKKYPEKVWGLKAEEIDKEVAEKRIPIISLTELLRAFFLKLTSHHHPETVKHNYYLKNGIGGIADFFKENILKNKGLISTTSTPTRILVKGNLVSGVEYTNKNGDTVIEECDFLLSTIPLNELIYLFETVPDKVTFSAGNLDYVSTTLLFISINKRKLLASPILYFTDSTTWFSRVSDVAAFSSSMVPEGKNLLCLEFPGSVGDKIWKLSVDELLAHAVTALSEKGVISKEDIEGAFLERVSHSYPKFRLGYKKHQDDILNFINSFENLISYGRQGGFSYINTDMAIHSGFVAANSTVVSKAAGFTGQKYFSIFSE